MIVLTRHLKQENFQCLKMSNVTTAHKKDKPAEKKIKDQSVILLLSKIFENLIYAQLRECTEG